MATEAEILGRQRIAAKVTAAAWERGWTSRVAAAAGCHMNEATYRAVVNNDGSYRPQDDTLDKLARYLGLDREELAQLRLGVLAVTGDAELDEHVALVRERPAEQRQPVYFLASLPADQLMLVYNFVRDLSAALRAS